MNSKRKNILVYLLFISFYLSADTISKSRENAITRAIEKVGPTVASINVIQDIVAPFGGDPWFNYFFPEMFYQKRKARSSGSGFVISPDGYVITNSHVVENASEVFVSLKGGKEYPAEIIGIDHISDIALLKLEGKDFEPSYVTMKDKTKVLKEIKNAAKNSELVYLATDPDREGEAIAWHIAEATKLPADKIKRIVFNEITESAIKQAITSSRNIDINLVYAQQARRVLDRLIGYTLSPLLSKKIQRGLSAGRVQSVAVKIICKREKEIQDFIPKEYWVIETDLKTVKQEIFTAKLLQKILLKNQIFL